MARTIAEMQAEQHQKDQAVACPACQAKAGSPCTTPTATGRRDVFWTHDARHDARMGWT